MKRDDNSPLRELDLAPIHTFLKVYQVKFRLFLKKNNKQHHHDHSRQRSEACSVMEVKPGTQLVSPSTINAAIRDSLPVYSVGSLW